MTRKKNGDSENVPKAVVSRLSLYLRELQRFEQAGNETISSTQLGKMLGITDAQVRKDFAYFGQFGYPGIGYRCHELIANIRGILGTDNRTWSVALVGCGNLGQALLGYKGFNEQGFKVEAAYDVNPEIIGEHLGQLTVKSLNDLDQDVKEKEMKLAILAVPAQAAQQVTDQLVRA